MTYQEIIAWVGLIVLLGYGVGVGTLSQRTVQAGPQATQTPVAITQAPRRAGGQGAPAASAAQHSTATSANASIQAGTRRGEDGTERGTERSFSGDE